MTPEGGKSIEFGALLREAPIKKLAEFIGVTIPFEILRRIYEPFHLEPAWGLALALPLALLAGLLLRRALGRGALGLTGPFRGFMIAYALLFAVAAGTDLFQWRRTPMTGLSNARPPNWLGLGWLGDWRYRLTPRSSRELHAGDFIVVTRAAPADWPTSRADLGDLIVAARRAGAIAVAADLRLEDSSALDARLCRQIEAARDATPSLSVILGYGFSPDSNDFVPQPLNHTIEACVPPARRGHLVVYRDADRVVRTLPLGFRGRDSFPALSVRVAELLGWKRTAAPSSGLLQPIPTDTPYPEIRFEDLNDSTIGRLSQRVVFVGVRSNNELFATPWGKLLGVQLHAQATHALLTGDYYRRLAWWPSVLVLLAGTYLLAVAATAGMGRGRIALLATGLTLGWFAVAAVAAWFRVWLDVGHVAAGLWVFAGAMLVRGVRGSTASRRPRT